MEALDRLRATLESVDSVLVALSGGVDSALVAHVAAQTLGDQAVAFTAHSPSLPREEAATARRVAQHAGIRHVELRTQELERAGYRANAGDRCYFCKTELFEVADRLRGELGLATIADGTVTDDLGDHRPGLKAARENAVFHPLVDAGLSKADVRETARHLGIEVWDKPSFACLGSRFPAGTPVSKEKLSRVDRAERAVRALGLRQFRVRWHEIEGDVLARIEVGPDEHEHVLASRESVVQACLDAGFRWVTLDLVPYGTRR